MKTQVQKLLMAMLLLASPIVSQAQFSYTTNNAAVTITGWSGAGGALTIPPTIDGLPVVSIGEVAFYECDLTSVIIPNSVISIEDHAFEGCSRLASVTIPNSVTSIENEAFGGCHSLTAIIVDTSNPAYLSVDGVLFDHSQTTLVEYPAGKVATTYNIPNGVTRIGSYAFFHCSSLTNVTIPNSVTSIGDASIAGCTSLTSVIIPNSVTSIGYVAFLGCTNLTSVTIPDSVTNALSGTFCECTGITNATIGNRVAGLEEGAFRSCTGLTSVIIPNSVTRITGGWFGGAFRGCTGLTNVIIPSSVTCIEGAAFAGCTRLTSLIIPASVTNIAEGAFSGCTSLTNLAIPDSVTNIGDRAFSDCTNLTGVYFQGNAPSAGLDVFAGVHATVYYRPGTAGWGTTFAGRPTAPWIVTPGRPQLGVYRTGGNLVLTWPTNAVGFTLQSTTNLLPTAVWSAVVPAPALVNGQNTVTNAISDLQRFYRLAQ